MKTVTYLISYTVAMKKATELKYRGYDLIILTEDDVITILGMK